MKKINIVVWDEVKTRSEVLRRYKTAADARSYFESGWRYNEKTVYSSGRTSSRSGLYAQVDSLYVVPEVDSSTADMSVSYLMKNFRFLHAQMSANPPAVVMRPCTSDQENARRADAADKVSRWAMKKYKMQEKIDQTSLNTLLYGTGILKTVWDASAGEIIDFNEENGELELEGDIDISVPFLWNIFVDPDARSIEKIKWVIEEIYMDYDEALQKWPGKEKVLESSRVGGNQMGGSTDSTTSSIGLLGTGSFNVNSERRYNTIKLIEYWEAGAPSNGYLGRYCITTPEGLVVEPVRPNPFRFRSGGAVWAVESRDDLSDEAKADLIKRLPERARLPYHFLTDIDVPNAVYGKSFVDYVAPLQENLSKLDSATIDAIQAHGIARMIVSEESEVTEMGNSNWEITKIASAGQQPYFVAPPQLMPEMDKTRVALVQGINDVAGVNESMFGQQSREQAAAAMQYATNQGNMIRRRLFNKYVLFVEELYRAILDLVRSKWDTSRTLHVVGKEHALEAIDIQGIDVDGGYDVVGDYGVSLSLDPVSRQQQLMMLQPLFKEAGISARRTLQLMKLSELESAYDEIQLADTRQSEIFEKMIALVNSGVPVEQAYQSPKKYMDHTNMIAYALRYFMTSEFQNLPDEVQNLCERHIDERAQLAAMERNGQAGTAASQTAGAPPGPTPQQPAPTGQPTNLGQPPLQNG